LISVWPNISFGLMPSLLLTVRKNSITYRLACAHDGIQFEPELLAHGLFVGAGECLHHGLECGGEQKGVRDTALAHQFQRQSRALNRPL
jgi:hypothetical protein